MPTPSQPINRINMFPATTRMIIARRKINRYLKNVLIFGSECIYQIENSKIFHVTKRAIGVKMIE